MPTSSHRNTQQALVARILEGSGQLSSDLRRAAFENAGLDGPPAELAKKVALQAVRITDEDLQAAKASGLTEDQIFELMVCAAVGQASREYGDALAALDEVEDAP